MSTESEQILAEAVRKYPALYDKQDKYFKGILMRVRPRD